MFADESQLFSDVFSQQSHIMMEVEVRGREDDGVAEDSLTSHPIELAGTKTADGSARSATKPQDGRAPHLAHEPHLIILMQLLSFIKPDSPSLLEATPGPAPPQLASKNK